MSIHLFANDREEFLASHNVKRGRKTGEKSDPALQTTAMIVCLIE